MCALYVVRVRLMARSAEAGHGAIHIENPLSVGPSSIVSESFAHEQPFAMNNNERTPIGRANTQVTFGSGTNFGASSVAPSQQHKFQRANTQAAFDQQFTFDGSASGEMSAQATTERRSRDRFATAAQTSAQYPDSVYQYTCNLCAKSYAYIEDLQAHMAARHS